MAENIDQGLPVSCQCGYIQFRTPTPKPLGISHCHCTECRKQSASAYGTSAYFPGDKLFPLTPDLQSKLATFTRPTDSGNTMHCYFCPKCGVRILHASHNPDGTMREVVAFKAGCVDGLDWDGARHIFTRSAVVKLPDNVEKYEAMPPMQKNTARS